MKRRAFSKSVSTITKEDRQRVYRELKNQRLTIEEIEKKIASLKKAFEYFDSEATACSTYYHRLKAQEETAKYGAIRKRATVQRTAQSQVQEAQSVKVGILASIFGNEATQARDSRIKDIREAASVELEDISREEKEELRRISLELNKEYTINGERVGGAAYWTHMRSNATGIKTELAALRKLLKEQSQHEKLLALRAKAASTEEEIRSLAPAVRKRLQEQFSVSNLCPYCGAELLPQDAHADHIYPVSKGGKSSVRNMVFVCSACNLSKGGRTLAQFLRDQGRNRDAIEDRLFHLNKDF